MIKYNWMPAVLSLASCGTDYGPTVCEFEPDWRVHDNSGIEGGWSGLDCSDFWGGLYWFRDLYNDHFPKNQIKNLEVLGPLDVDIRPESGPFAGWYNGSAISVDVRPDYVCLRPTAYIHELLHLMLERSGQDVDNDHNRLAIWLWVENEVAPAFSQFACPEGF